MSIRQLNLVWEHSQQRGGALLMMLAIADFADDQGVAYPAVETLARKARMSERNARYVLRDLENCGELGIEQNAGPKGANLYRIKLTPNLELFARKGAKVAEGAKVAPGAESDTKGGKTQQKGGQPVAPEPSGTIKEPSGRYTPSADVLAWIKEAGFEPYLEAHIGYFRDYIAQPKNRKRYVDLDAAFRNCVRGDWGDVRKQAQVAARHGQPTGISGGVTDWWKTPDGVAAMGKRLGVERQDREHLQPWENAMWFKARVCVAAGEGPWCDEKDGTFQHYLKRAREAVAHA